MSDDIRLLLVDDQELLRYGFRLVLEAKPGITVVGEAADGAEAIAAAKRFRPDVVLMDVRMPGMDGIEATKRLTSDLPETRVLVLTTYDLDEYAFGALGAGAAGFLLKDTRPDDLVAAIRAVHSGDAVVSPRITAKLIEVAAPHLGLRRAAEPGPHGGADAAAGVTGGFGVTGGVGATAGAGSTGAAASGVAAGGIAGRGAEAVAALSVLTAREREIFVLIGRGDTNGEIAATLHLSESTVKANVGRVLAKLHLRNRVEAVIRAYELGVVAP